MTTEEMPVFSERSQKWLVNENWILMWEPINIAQIQSTNWDLSQTDKWINECLKFNESSYTDVEWGTNLLITEL